jgi:hypothetical protein
MCVCGNYNLIRVLYSTRLEQLGTTPAQLCSKRLASTPIAASDVAMVTV